jgi:hypothetical protein
MGAGGNATVRIAYRNQFAPRAIGELDLPALTIMNEQERADRFHELVRSGEWERLATRSAADIHTLLGDPSEVLEFEHNGHRWLQIVYRFAVPPSNANDEERSAIGRGMEFAPALMLRDGIVVDPSRFNEEVLGGAMTAGPPRDVTWKPGGSFP